MTYPLATVTRSIRHKAVWHHQITVNSMYLLERSLLPLDISILVPVSAVTDAPEPLMAGPVVVPTQPPAARPT